MISNCDFHDTDVIQLTNEMPLNRRGGVGSVIENLISGFAGLGLRSVWFLSDHGYTGEELKGILETFPNVVVGTLEEMIRFRAPVIHIHTYNNEILPVSHFSHVRTVFTAHSLLMHESISNDMDMTKAIRMQERNIDLCDEIVLVSESELEKYHELGYHKLNSHVHVIHNGIRHRILTEKHHYGKKMIGFCGRLVPRKRPEYVQMILKEKGFEDCTAMIAGRGFSSYARDLVDELGIHDRIRFLGWCGGARLEAFFEAIDVLAVPSVYEPFGLAALEAAARGIPVVCPRVGGLAELMGEYAFYYEGKDFESFMGAMRNWMAADSAAVREHINGAYTRFENHFTDLIMARKYQKLYQGD